MKLSDLSPRSPVIVAIKRTAVLPFRSHFSKFSAHELGTLAIKGLIESLSLDPQKIERAYLGNVLQAGQGQAPCRQAVLNAGLGHHVDCSTINKVCASGLWTGALAANDIRLGIKDFVLAGGFESMTNAPHLLPNAVRMGMAYGGGAILDSMQHDGLSDPWEGGAMGCYSDFIAAERELSREAQDAYATESYRRSTAAIEAGLFADEIIPVSIPQRKGDPLVVDTDGEPALGRPEKFAALRPAFGKEGTATAANSSSIDDGACVYLVAAAEACIREGLTPIAHIAGYDAVCREPKYFTVSPVAAAQKVAAQVGWDINEVPLHEVNEAFSTVPLAYMKELNIDHEKVNVLGGAVSLGHPIGASGARILSTCLTAMKDRGAERALLSICNGGGGAAGMAVELLDQ